MTAGGKEHLDAMTKDGKFQLLMAKCCGQPGTALHEGKPVHGWSYKGYFFFFYSNPAKTVIQPPEQKSGEL